VVQRIEVGSGPEDMAVDVSMGYERIIVSCDERRKDQTKIGAFYGINPQDNSAFQFKIIPTDFQLHPHGIDVVTIDSVPWLYAISHELDEGEMHHRVYRFEIKNDSLLLDKEQVMEHELMNVPNDLDVLDDGSFYASNFVPSMDPMESTKAILGMKRGSVVHYDGKGNWELALTEMCYPNGIWVDTKQDYFYVANGGCQEVAKYKITGGKIDPNSKESTKQHGLQIPIGDNLLLDNEGVLWTAAHPCPLNFLEHAEDINKKSPMQVFSIDPSTLKSQMTFQNNGELISAASTVLRLNGQLYISQVFDPFVLVVK
jgi:hypothetical protein